MTELLRGAASPDRTFAAPLPSAGAGQPPVFRMPFERGEVVYCQQGNESPAGFSHSAANTRYAFDFSNEAEDELAIVAAADGEVIQVVTGAGPGDVTPGSGFGNFVKIAHSGGYLTMYSHLDQIAVAEGQAVISGDFLGTMGDTGMAGNRHLHFSLHDVVAAGPGATLSIPFEKLYLADADQGRTFESLDGRDLVCDMAALSGRGHLYGSESSPAFELGEGVDSPELADTLDASVRSYRTVMEGTTRLGNIMNQFHSQGPQWVAEELEQLIFELPELWEAAAVVAELPVNWEGQYWLGVVLLRDLQRVEEGAARFQIILDAHESGVLIRPTWAPPWSYLRMAVVQIERGDRDGARASLEAVLAFPEDGSGFSGHARALLDQLATTPSS